MAWPAAVRQVALVPADAAGSGTDPAGLSGVLPGNGRLNGRLSGTLPDAEAPVADVVIPAATVLISSMTVAVRDIIGRAERGKDILASCPGVPAGQPGCGVISGRLFLPLGTRS
jgi:hypothetical protein